MNYYGIQYKLPFGGGCYTVEAKSKRQAIKIVKREMKEMFHIKVKIGEVFEWKGEKPNGN